MSSEIRDLFSESSASDSAPTETEAAAVAVSEDTPEVGAAVRTTSPARVEPEPEPESESEEAEEAGEEEDEELEGDLFAGNEELEALEPEAAPVEEIPRELIEDVEPTDTSNLPILQTADAETAEIDPAKLDQEALKVVYRLRQFGYEAYFVGGCVRDLLLGKVPKDFDVATSAYPNEVRGVFRNCRLIGRRFRLAHVYFKGGKIIEVSTFRANPTEELPAHSAEEAGAEAAEAPHEDDLLITQDNVFGTAEEDARRRDFTINGLFYDVVSGQVIDYVRGRRDLDERFIRTIGNPDVRLREDPVRILRAVRFACKLGLDIESRTYAAMEGAVEDLPRCAPARLLEETFRLIRGGISTDSIKLLDALGALRILLPPVADYFKRTGLEGTERFYRHMLALDARVKAGDQLEDAALLATILLPIANEMQEHESEQDEGKPPMVAQAIEDLLAELVRNARLPRRIAERCRMILIAQRTLSGQRRRRGALAAFRRHPLFNEALTLFEISVEATGEFRDQLEAWKAGGAPKTAPGAEGPHKRKRRRRRRTGGPRPEGEAAKAEPASTSDSTPDAGE
ncbi:MAG: polynucleotide adenylyltransferase PcnB [Myxococcaceae bacterium]